MSKNNYRYTICLFPLLFSQCKDNNKFYIEKRREKISILRDNSMQTHIGDPNIAITTSIITPQEGESLESMYTQKVTQLNDRITADAQTIFNKVKSAAGEGDADAKALLKQFGKQNNNLNAIANIVIANQNVSNYERFFVDNNRLLATEMQSTRNEMSQRKKDFVKIQTDTQYEFYADKLKDPGVLKDALRGSTSVVLQDKSGKLGNYNLRNILLQNKIVSPNGQILKPNWSTDPQYKYIVDGLRTSFLGGASIMGNSKQSVIQGVQQLASHFGEQVNPNDIGNRSNDPNNRFNSVYGKLRSTAPKTYAYIKKLNDSGAVGVDKNGNPNGVISDGSLSSVLSQSYKQTLYNQKLKNQMESTGQLASYIFGEKDPYFNRLRSLVANSPNGNTELDKDQGIRVNSFVPDKNGDLTLYYQSKDHANEKDVKIPFCGFILTFPDVEQRFSTLGYENIVSKPRIIDYIAFKDIYTTLEDGLVIPKFKNVKNPATDENRLALEQSVSEKWGNGINKALIRMGSVFFYTYSVPYCVFKVIEKRRFSAYYENPFFIHIHDVDKELFYSMPNYYSDEEKKMNFIQKLGTANFWADSVLFYLLEMIVLIPVFYVCYCVLENLIEYIENIKFKKTA